MEGPSVDTHKKSVLGRTETINFDFIFNLFLFLCELVCLRRIVVTLDSNKWS